MPCGEISSLLLRGHGTRDHELEPTTVLSPGPQLCPGTVKRTLSA